LIPFTASVWSRWPVAAFAARKPDKQGALTWCPLLLRSIELIREIAPAPGPARVSDDPQRLALLLWSGLHGIVSLRVNKPTIEWPRAVELAEQIVRAIIRPDVAPR
jgi:hypothetical protein